MDSLLQTSSQHVADPAAVSGVCSQLLGLGVPAKDSGAQIVAVQACLVPKIFQDSLSNRIFEYMHEVLNIVLKNNQLHNLAVNDEINLLSLFSS